MHYQAPAYESLIMKRILAILAILSLATPVYAARLATLGFETGGCTNDIEVTTVSCTVKYHNN